MAEGGGYKQKKIMIIIKTGGKKTNKLKNLT